MDCDFFEHSYYYTQPGPQGEMTMTSDDLSWVVYPVMPDQVVSDSTDPKEQVGEATDTVSDIIVSPL